MKATLIGIDLAKNVFQLHGASLTGEVKFRKKLLRGQLLRFIAEQHPALVVMEACGGAHHWARELTKLGHEVKLIAPQYVRRFVKRQKNDVPMPRRSSRRPGSLICALLKPKHGISRQERFYFVPASVSSISALSW